MGPWCRGVSPERRCLEMRMMGETLMMQEMQGLREAPKQTLAEKQRQRSRGRDAEAAGSQRCRAFGAVSL